MFCNDNAIKLEINHNKRVKKLSFFWKMANSGNKSKAETVPHIPGLKGSSYKIHEAPSGT